MAAVEEGVGLAAPWGAGVWCSAGLDPVDPPTAGLTFKISARSLDVNKTAWVNLVVDEGGDHGPFLLSVN